MIKAACDARESLRFLFLGFFVLFQHFFSLFDTFNCIMAFLLSTVNRNYLFHVIKAKGFLKSKTLYLYVFLINRAIYSYYVKTMPEKSTWRRLSIRAVLAVLTVLETILVRISIYGKEVTAFTVFLISQKIKSVKTAMFSYHKDPQKWFSDVMLRDLQDYFVSTINLALYIYETQENIYKVFIWFAFDITFFVLKNTIVIEFNSEAFPASVHDLFRDNLREIERRKDSPAIVSEGVFMNVMSIVMKNTLGTPVSTIGYLT